MSDRKIMTQSQETGSESRSKWRDAVCARTTTSGQGCRQEGGVAGAARGISGSGHTAAHGFFFMIYPDVLLGSGKKSKKGGTSKREKREERK